MTIYTSDFVFDGKTNYDYGLNICNFNSSGLSINEGIGIELSTANIQNNWLITSGKYSKANSITFQVAKNDFSEITTFELAPIQRWFQRNDNKYYLLQFGQCDYEDIYFNAKCTSFKPISLANSIVGIEFTFITDAPYGYSRIYNDTYDLGTTSTHIDYSEEVGCLYPDMTITITGDCTFSIYNSLTNATTQITNCKAGEVITFNHITEEWTTTDSSHNIIECYNFIPFAFANTLSTRKNQLTFEGLGQAKFSYRLIKKIM